MFRIGQNAVIYLFILGVFGYLYILFFPSSMNQPSKHFQRNGDAMKSNNSHQFLKSYNEKSVHDYDATKEAQYFYSTEADQGSSYEKDGGKTVIPIFDRYISCSYKTCSGIGNQMFRFASLYGIGRHFNRTPFFHANLGCQQKYMSEIKEIFPNFYNTVKLLTADSNDTKKSDFALDCCRYQNPIVMHDVQEKYLILNGNYLQSYKFFNDRKAEIKHLFEFGKSIKKSVEKEGKKIFGDDNSHKLCIHIRRGDFIKHEILESRADFIEPSIEFLHQNLTAKGYTNISLIFLGTDYNFTKNLKFNQSGFVSIYHPALPSRGEDMYFGIRYCNTLLISASGSTFGWWIGYLLPEGTQIFYNEQVSKDRNYSKQIHDFDLFPSEWDMLKLNRTKNIVEIDNRWYYERFSWPSKGSIKYVY